jgi:hypothetical protein
MSWRTPCVDDPEKWAGEDWALRRQAAKECLTCPRLIECAAETQEMRAKGLEVTGVSGGVDYTHSRTGRGSKPAVTECEWCGVTLMQQPTGARRRYCSENHGYLARREAKAS